MRCCVQTLEKLATNIRFHVSLHLAPPQGLDPQILFCAEEYKKHFSVSLQFQSQVLGDLFLGFSQQASTIWASGAVYTSKTFQRRQKSRTYVEHNVNKVTIHQHLLQSARIVIIEHFCQLTLNQLTFFSSYQSCLYIRQITKVNCSSLTRVTQ